jgi:uncharacterized protein
MKSREFQIFAKPVGASCNLNCSYCYYLDKKDLYPEKDYSVMSDEILELYIKQHIEASTETTICFSWHGGEPLLAGIPFYRKILNFQTKYKPLGSAIINGIQTNGTLITDEWCRFFSENGFAVGVSLDGPASFHNLNRRNIIGENTFQKVIDGYELLRKYGISLEILCVVNSKNVESPLEIYNFFKSLHTGFLTFLPLVEAVPDCPGQVSSNSVTADKFGFFLAEIFDQWVENDIGTIKIQIFEEALRTAFNQEHTLCVFKKKCGGVPVVERNGDFYSCDHYVNRNHLHGNIKDHPVSYFLDSQKQKTFGDVKSVGLPKYCLQCEVRSMCNGECPKNRIIVSPDGEYGLNYLCKGYRYFFNHCHPFIEAIAELWKES